MTIHFFIAVMEEGDSEPDDNSNGDDPVAEGVDLAAWVFSDVNDEDFSRNICYNVYNIGSQDALASSQWAVYYLYFNAYDANDYGFIFYDSWTDAYLDVPAGHEDWIDNLEYAINQPLPAGNDMANYLYGKTEVCFNYIMPQITGEYYLVLIADAYDDFEELDETNNYFYTSDYPIEFFDGISSRQTGHNPIKDFKPAVSPDQTTLKENAYQTVVTKDFKNAYTNDEIRVFLKREKQSGRLDQKLRNFQKRTRIH